MAVGLPGQVERGSGARTAQGCEGRITGGNEGRGRGWRSPTEGLCGECWGSRLGWGRAAFSSGEPGEGKLGNLGKEKNQ